MISLKSPLQTAAEAQRFAALRAMLRDDTGTVAITTKAEAFKALPSKSPALDISV